MDLLKEHQSQMMKFVTFKESVALLATKYPEATNSQLAEILLRKMLREERPLLEVYFLSATNEMVISSPDANAHNNATSANIIENMYECIINGTAYSSEFSKHVYYEMAGRRISVENYGFKREALQKFFHDIGQDIDVYKSAQPATSADALPFWNTHEKGMETALKFVAGLSIALGKSGSKYRRGEKLNHSAIAKAAQDALIDFNPDVEIVTERQLTNLINEALKKYSPLLKES